MNPKLTHPLAASIISILALFSSAGCTSMSSTKSEISETVSSRAQVGNYYFLPTGKVRIAGELAEGVGYKLTISRFNVPDRNARYFLRQHANPFFDDSTLLEVDGQGLLTTANVESEDKTGAIIDKVTETVINMAKIAANLSGGGFQAFGVEDIQPSKLAPFNCTFDPLNTAEVSAAAKIMRAAGFTLNVSDGNGAKSQFAASGEKLATGGVYYRPPRVVDINVTTSVNDVAYLIEQTSVRVPDRSQIAVLSLSRPFLVKKTTNLAFVGGDLTKIDYKKPSEALAFVTIPASVTGKVAEAIPSLIQVRDSRANAGLVAEKARLDAQKGVLDSQLALRKSQDALIGQPGNATPSGLSAQGVGNGHPGPVPYTLTEKVTRARAAQKNAEAELFEAALRERNAKKAADAAGAKLEDPKVEAQKAAERAGIKKP